MVIALTHIGFTENPSSVEVDTNVDTNLATTVTGMDAIIGGHSHTNPATGFGAYKYLPTIVADPDGKPVLINQAYRYNNTLGEVVIGLRAKAGGGYEVVSQTGRYLTVTSATAEDAAIKAIVDPYVTAWLPTTTRSLARPQPRLTPCRPSPRKPMAPICRPTQRCTSWKKHGIAVDFHLSGAMTNKADRRRCHPGYPVS